jgi:hypothetical protein
MSAFIFGNPDQFAFEFGIFQAFNSASIPANGHAIIHVNGMSYGRDDPEASSLGYIYGDVEYRLSCPGGRVIRQWDGASAEQIARSYVAAFHTSEGENTELHLSRDEFIALVNKQRLGWASSGEEAWDDGSVVLQFDVGTRVRLVAFKTDYVDSKTTYHTFTERYVESAEFYQVLSEWKAAFDAEWNRQHKFEIL